MKSIAAIAVISLMLALMISIPQRVESIGIGGVSVGVGGLGGIGNVGSNPSAGAGAAASGCCAASPVPERGAQRFEKDHGIFRVIIIQFSAIPPLHCERVLAELRGISVGDPIGVGLPQALVKDSITVIDYSVPFDDTIQFRRCNFSDKRSAKAIRDAAINIEFWPREE